MAYVTRDDMLGVVPDDLLTTALDDQNFGMETDGAWDQVEAAAARRVDGILGSRYPTPFRAPLKPVVIQAAVTFVAELLYIRRGYETNPFKDAASSMEKRLQRIADGKADLEANETGSGSDDPVAITEESLTYNNGRLIL